MRTLFLLLSTIIMLVSNGSPFLQSVARDYPTTHLEGQLSVGPGSLQWFGYAGGTETTTVDIAWVQPSGVTWGPPNTLTVAGWARNGTGGVQITWKDLTARGPWNPVAWKPEPNSVDATWSNTIPVSNYCHDYQVYATYAGTTSTIFTYRGLNSGYCNEQARMIWIQPQSSAGFGPPGSLVIAGSATGAPAGTRVSAYWRNITLNTRYIKIPYDAPTDENGIWLNTIENANHYHRYEVFVTYDVVRSSPCTYQGTNSITWC